MIMPNPSSKILEDETELSEISLQADGRIYVFGMTREILEILAGLDPQSHRLQSLLVQTRIIPQ